MLSLLLQLLISVSGVWNAWGYNSGDWAHIAPLLSSNGFDTVFYCASYWPDTDIDGLNECIDACNQYDIDVHAWVIMWKIHQTPEAQSLLPDLDGRLQVGVNGDTAAGNWLCPTDPDNVAEMASVCLRIAAETSVRGIHLDYIRYASNRVCFCDGCRERFQRETGTYGIQWPEDCEPGGRLYTLYNNWRAEGITAAVQAVRDSLSRLNKVVELSAAVLPREREMAYFAQFWTEWLDSGLVDFVIPMNYTVSDSELVCWGENQLEIAGNHTMSVV